MTNSNNKYFEGSQNKKYSRVEMEAQRMSHKAYNSICRNLAYPYLQCLETLSHLRFKLDPKQGQCSHLKEEYIHCQQREASYNGNGVIQRLFNNNPKAAGEQQLSPSFQENFQQGLMFKTLRD